MDRGAWWATAPGVTKSQTQLKQLRNDGARQWTRYCKNPAERQKDSLGNTQVKKSRDLWKIKQTGFGLWVWRREQTKPSGLSQRGDEGCRGGGVTDCREREQQEDKRTDLGRGWWARLCVAVGVEAVRDLLTRQSHGWGVRNGPKVYLWIISIQFRGISLDFKIHRWTL